MGVAARPRRSLWASRGSRMLSFGVVWCVLLQTSAPTGRPTRSRAHGRRCQALLVRWPAGLKPRSPLLACVCVGVKPPSPLRAPAEPQMKPPSPSRVRNGCLWCSFRAQRCRRFQRCLVGGEQWCCWFQRRHVSASCARSFSPCKPNMGENAVFRRAGRVFSWKCRWNSRTGRVFRGTAAESPHGARVVRPQSSWAPLVSEEKLRMQFPSRHFKS